MNTKRTVDADLLDDLLRMAKLAAQHTWPRRTRHELTTLARVCLAKAETHRLVSLITDTRMTVEEFGKALND